VNHIIPFGIIYVLILDFDVYQNHVHKSFREIYDDFWKKKSDLYNIITKTSL